MPQNLIEKIAQQFAVNLSHEQTVKSGDYLAIAPAYLLTHDNTAAVMGKFNSLGAQKIFNPRQLVFALDHNVQDHSTLTQTSYSAIERFAADHGIDFYPAGRGIGHQIMLEEGYVWPGTMVVASDSHANMYGGLGVLGTPLVRTDAAAIWATGQTWWQVPQVVKVELTGSLRPGVTGKDVILTLTGVLKADEVLNYALEFAGDGLASLGMDQRFTIANMTTEWGALAGVFPVDKETYSWLERRTVAVEKRGLAGVPSDEDAGTSASPRLNFDNIARLKPSAPYADPDAFYAKEIRLDLGQVSPSITGPDAVKHLHDAKMLERENIRIQKAYLLSCVNSRASDLAEAAQIVRGKRIAPGVEFYVAAASREVQSESEKSGDWQALLDAGAKVLPPGCGPCIGLGAGLLKSGEIAISATNRNFKGRMGARDAQVYLASPAVVAASAVAGKLASPYTLEAIQARIMVENNSPELRPEGIIELLPEFPRTLSGRLLFCHQDQLNTDAIYPSKYTYREDMTPREMARAVMENYDHEFGKIVAPGDILVGGFGFGSGSSREQAATALKHCGIALVLAGSFSETFKRNALNNGLLTLEAPDLVEELVQRFGRKQATISTDQVAEIDFERAKLSFNMSTYLLPVVGRAAQEIFISNGLENWVKERL